MNRVWEVGVSIVFVFLLTTSPVAATVDFQHSASTQRTANALQTTAAQITATEAERGTYQPGESVPIEFTVENTGDTAHEFYVDASVQRPDGGWVTGEGTTVYLAPGETRTVTLNGQIPDDAEEGTWSAGSGVFHSPDKDDQYDYGQDIDSFTVESPSTAAEVTSTYAESGTYRPGESVPVEVTVENTGDTTHDFYVDASVQRPNGDWVTGEGTTVYLSPGETESVTLDGEIPDDAEEGTWSAGSGVFHSSDKDEQYDYGQDLDSLTVESPSTAAEITGTYAESGTYQPGESVPVEVTVENTGDTTHDFYVDASVQRPDGGWITGEGTTVYLSPGETETVTLDGAIPDDAEEGTWSAGAGVFHSNGKDDRYDGDQDLESFEVRAANEAPSVARESPSGDPSITAGESVEFQAAAEDSDGNLERVEWYLDGDYVETQRLDGGSDTATWSHRFESTGTYTVEAVVSDTEDAYSQSVEWDITVEQPDTTTARITRTVADGDSYSPGESVPVEVTVENTGDTSHDFYVDASVQRPNGDWVTGEGTTVYLSPGETETVTLDGEIPDDAEAGTWSAGAGVFHSNGKDDRYDGDQDLESFEVRAANEAPSVARESPSSDPSVAVGESVEFQAAAEDSDGNLERIEWYLDGERIETSRVDGSTAVGEFSTAFEQAGTIEISAVAVDGEDMRSDAASWEVTVDDSEPSITSVTLPDSPTYGKPVAVGATIRTPAGSEFDGTVQIMTNGSVVEERRVRFDPNSERTVGFEDAFRMNTERTTVGVRVLNRGSVASSQTRVLESERPTGGTLRVVRSPESYQPGEPFDVSVEVINPTAVEQTYVVAPAENTAASVETGTERITLEPETGREITYTVTVPEGTSENALPIALSTTDTRQLDEATVSLDRQTSERIDVRVTDQQGQPVPGADVSVQDGSAETTTDDDGTATLVLGQPGTTLVVVDSDEFTRAYQEVSVTEGEQTAVSLTLQRTATVSGTVRDETGSPIDQGVVEVGGREADIRDGSFQYERGFTPGTTYDVVVRTGGEVVRHTEVTVEGGSNDLSYEVSRESDGESGGLSTSQLGYIAGQTFQSTVYKGFIFGDSGSSFGSIGAGSDAYETGDESAGSSGSATTFLDQRVAEGYGSLVGLGTGLKETVEGVLDILTGPLEFVRDMIDLVSAVLDDLGVIEEILKLIPQQIQEKQQQANPYTEDTELNQSYARGWYGGYATAFIAEAVVGSKGAGKLSKVSKLNKVKKAPSKANLVRVGIRANKLDIPGADTDNLRRALQALNRYERVDSARVSGFTKDLETIQDVEGSNRLVSQINNAVDTDSVSRGGAKNFRGTAFEARYAAQKQRDGVELVEVQRPQSTVSRPGDIDVVTRESTKTVGRELKRKEYRDTSEFKQEIGQIDSGYKQLVDEGVVDEYEIVFGRELTPDQRRYLEEKDIPYDVEANE